MNQRIQELINTCTIEVEDIDKNDETFYWTTFDKEKFAELIVRECIHITLKDSLPDWDNASSEANAQCIKIAVDLRQHFGVEE